MARIPCCCGCGVGRWKQPPIRPLAWEPPYATGVAQEIAIRQKKKKKVLPSILGSIRSTQARCFCSGVPVVAQRVKNPASTHEDEGLIAGLA